MKTMMKPAILAVACTAALAFVGNALAVQKMSVTATTSPSALTIKVSQAQTDPQPAKITIYVPSGYQFTTTAPAGTTIGTTTGTVFARDLNIPLPLSGNVVVQPSAGVAQCDAPPHLTVWVLQLSVAGQTINLPVHVDQTFGTETALGAFKLVVCLGPADVPAGTPGRSPNGAQLLDATFTVNNIFQAPVGPVVWKALWTPYTAGTGTPNAAGTVETRAIVGPGTISLSARIASRARRTVRLTGAVSQAGAAVAGARVSLLLNGRARFSGRTNASGRYTITLRKTGRRSTTTFQARVTVAERDITSTGCANPSVPGVNCVSATASGFTAVSRRVRVRI